MHDRGSELYLLVLKEGMGGERRDRRVRHTVSAVERPEELGTVAD